MFFSNFELKGKYSSFNLDKIYFIFYLTILFESKSINSMDLKQINNAVSVEWYILK